MSWLGRAGRAAVSALVSATLAGCSATSALTGDLIGPPAPKLGTLKPVTGFPGAVVADNPDVVRVGQHILLNDGSAADAAVAMAFATAVALPSRAGLGGGGACLAYKPGDGPNRGAPRAFLFAPVAPAVQAGNRPASVPMLALGLFALHDAYGALPIAQDIVPAERMARFGVPVSAQLAQDLQLVGSALQQDKAAAEIFGPSGSPLGQGELLVDTDLANVLARLRVAGATDFYTGATAKAFVAGSAAAGGPVTGADLARAKILLGNPLIVNTKHYAVGFIPNEAGVAAAATFLQAHKTPDNLEGLVARSLGAIAAARKGMSGDKILAGGGGTATQIGGVPASSSLIAMDRGGDVVACDLTMDNLFGTGRVAPGTGMLLAVSPSVFPRPLLASAIAWSPGAHAFRAAVSASGQEAASAAAGYGMFRALNAKVAMPGTVPSPGRINAIACAGLLPGAPQTCTWATDPRGDGLALSSY